MRRTSIFRLINIILFLSGEAVMAGAAPAIIPEPQTMKFEEGHFQLQPGHSVLGLFRNGWH